MSIKPIKVWGQLGPNPPKVAMTLGELGITPDFQPIEFSQVKSPEYLAVNPNGRIPSIHDPNTNLTLWESGAIIEYLVDKYDKDHKISFAPGTPESYLAKQWLYFQVSGQGPYYGQGVWFMKFHPEKVPSAVERYVNEMKRVTGVLEGHLSKQEKGADGPWLVGGKFSFADLAWIPWQNIVGKAMAEQGFDENEYPVVKDWLERMGKRPAIKHVLETGLMPSSAH